MSKKDKNSLLNIQYSRTLTSDNLSKASNYVGEYVLKGLGTLGKFLNAGFTSPTYGTTGQVSYARNAKDAKRLRELSEASEQAMGKAMTWVSPLNYGAAVWNGHGLDARKGEEEVASWSPAWQAVGRLGELYIGPKAVKGVKAAPKTVINTAAKAGVKPAKAAVVAREIKQGIKLNTKNGKIEVTEDYFNSPDKWYRITETPEKYGIMELGKNITTHDAALTVGTINGWRSSMLKAPITKSSEGFIKRPHKIEIGIRIKNGLAHGNTSQAAKGKLWGGTTSGSNLFPEGVIEGQAPSMINYGIDRTNFVVTPWEEVPNGGRVGFHTGEMPMSNLGWFQRTNKGTYTYEPIIPEKRITYHPILLLEPSTSLKFFERKPSKISGAERAGVPKGERNFKPKWHVANYPGYLLKGLMKGSLLEKQLSKNGTININLLNAYFNKASQIEKEIANKVLSEKFVGLKTVDYNLFKKAVLDELIGKYNRVPLTKYDDYGLNRLGIFGYRKKTIDDMLTKPSIEFEEKYEIVPNLEGVTFYEKANPLKGPIEREKVQLWIDQTYNLNPFRLNTFTFESLRLPLGNSKHYDASTLGHSRTYTTPEEPRVLHVMESQSDWGLTKLGNNSAPYTGTTKYLNNPTAYRKFIDGHKRLLAKMLENPSDYLAGAIERQIANIEHHEAILKLILGQEGQSPLAKYLHDNYLLRQLQENLRYAAENGLTKMRYPTSETAAKIEGYLKVNHTKLNELSNLQMKLGELFENGKISWEEYDKMINDINKLKKELFGKEYDPKHQTILKKYADFPKLFLKLFKDLQVRTATDAKRNTWYEVDVPKGYLSREWQFKQGGKMNILEFLKNGSGIHIKKKNRGKFTSYCGGTVTDECIRRGKNSSSATIRKRATFAANARKWKHKKGGKAFVEGVNVLDSNSDAYKYVKKKYKMRSAAGGSKVDWGGVANTIGGLSNSIMNIAKTFKNLKAIDLMKEANASMLNAYKSQAINNAYNDALNNESNKSDIVNRFNAYNLATNSASQIVALKQLELNLQVAQAEQANAVAQLEAWTGAIKDLGGLAINALNKKGMTLKAATQQNYFNNSNALKNKEYGTFNTDGSMNLGNGLGTFSVKDGYKANLYKINFNI